MTMEKDSPTPMSAPPPHTRTESTLAPTAEFTRIFLLAWIIRYIFRGASGALFEEKLTAPGLRSKIMNVISSPGRVLQGWLGGTHKLSELEAASYSLAIGAGSGLLSWRYGNMVRNDIMNLFREAVADEKGIPQEQVTFRDISSSENAIIRRTVQNYHGKMVERLGTDALFFLAAPLKSGHITDLLLGTKGLQIFGDTWKRKTTMFEDLVTFVNNKINPRNGLGQPVNIGEVFDLYQHYAEGFHPDRMFKSVLGSNPEDIARWSHTQPVFQRITDLMNQTYAYKHSATNKSAEPFAGGANLALPKLIHLLGHDYINPDRPQESLLAVEVVNARGIPALKHMRAALAQGQSVTQVAQQFGVTLPLPSATKAAGGEKNGVLAKGSTMQLDQAEPANRIDTASIAHEAPSRTAALQA